MSVAMPIVAKAYGVSQLGLGGFLLVVGFAVAFTVGYVLFAKKNRGGK
jgi:predicted permease